MEQLKRPRGRPAVALEQRSTELVTLRLTPALRAKLGRLGGSAWVRERIERARDPAPHKSLNHDAMNDAAAQALIDRLKKGA